MTPKWIEFECKNQHVNFCVLIEPSAMASAKVECLKDATRETGGILIGHYSADLRTAFITDIQPPTQDSQKSRTLFVRGTRGLKVLLSRLWKESRTFYLGEWHYHPHSSPLPSSIDSSSMKEIANDPNSQCAVPILLILGGNPADESQPIYAAIFPAELGHLVVLTGDAFV